MKADTGRLSLVGFLKPFLSLGVSLALGCSSGVVLSLLLHWRPSSQRAFATLSRRIGPAISAQYAHWIIALADCSSTQLPVPSLSLLHVPAVCASPQRQRAHRCPCTCVVREGHLQGCGCSGHGGVCA